MVELSVFFSVFSKSPVDVLLYLHNLKRKKEKKNMGKVNLNGEALQM